MIIPIRKFGGMITNPLQEDIPDFSSVWNQNVDPAYQGQLRGVPVAGNAYQANGNVEIPDAYESAWISYNRPDVTINVSTHSTHPNEPIVITTDGSHNLATGDTVVISDVDPITANGTWKITVISATTFSIPIATTGDYVSGGSVAYTGGDKWDLVYIDKEDADIVVIEDFYNGTETYRTFNDLVDVNGATSRPSPYISCVKAFNNKVHIGSAAAAGGIPFVVHRLTSNKSMFASAEAVLCGLYAEDGYCYNDGSTAGTVQFTSVAETEGSAPKYFSSAIRYSWGLTLVYDGIQESQLFTDATNASDVPTTDSEKYTVNIKALTVNSGGAGDPTNMDTRVTAVRIYRAESSNDDSANLGLYRLVDEIDINTGTSATNWVSATNDYTFAYVDNGGYPGGGQTYEEETGIPETLDYPFVYYEINEVGGGYYWMGDPYVVFTNLSVDWSKYIFRSQKFRPNMVDWSGGNHLVLPETPIELKYYNDKLYAFTENKLYRINPELLIIEDEFEGVGVSAQGGVVATEFGMFFCNLNGAYRLFNNQITTISDPIKTTTNSTKTSEYWGAFAVDALLSPGTIGRIIAGYLADKKCVLFIGQAPAASTTLAFVYHLPTDEWYMWTLTAQPLDANSGLVTGKDGELYWSGTTTLNELLGGASFEDHDWLSKEFTLGKPSQDKLWKKLVWDSSGTVAVKYGVEGTYPATAATSGTYINTYQKTLQVLIDSTTSAT